MQCKNVLIVEDDEGIRETLRLALELEGYSVFSAANGQEGLDILPKIERPCLILLDLMMPVMDGWRFVEILDEDTILAAIPVVVVTAFAERAKSIHARGILKKPIDLDVLLATVKRYCA